MKVFGPVFSDRFGLSLIINNLAHEYCPYSCIYCRVGDRISNKVARSVFYAPEEIYSDVQDLVIKSREAGHKIDYFVFFPDGEPMLDINIGKTIDLLKLFGSKIAVKTNGSLLFRQDVIDDLKKADYVSLKIDTLNEEIWQKINHPNCSLKFKDIFSAITKFAGSYDGLLVTETMLVGRLNTNDQDIKKMAAFLMKLNPYRAYLSIPSVKLSNDSVRSSNEATINRIYQIMSKVLKSVEFLIEYKDDVTNNNMVEQELLTMITPRPMSKNAIESILGKTGTDWNFINQLIFEDKLSEIEYDGNKFYVRRFQDQPDIDKDKYSGAKGLP